MNALLRVDNRVPESLDIRLEGDGLLRADVSTGVASATVLIILYGYHPINDFLANFIYQSTYVPGAVGCSMIGMIILIEPVIMINRLFPVKEAKNVDEDLEVKEN